MPEININYQQKGIEFQSEIQDFGYLIGVSKTTFLINFVSENISEIFSTNAQLILNQPILDYLDLETELYTVSSMESGEFFRVEKKISDIHFYIILYTLNNIIYIEIEEFKREDFLISDFSLKAEMLLYSRDKYDNWQNLLDAIKILTDFDRILIYRCDDEGGIVIAENKSEDLENYLGLQYRELEFFDDSKVLFLKKKSHYIFDSERSTCNIISNNNSDIDLSLSEFRPLDIKYQECLSESNHKSRFCVAIIINNFIWGYVAGFNNTKKYITSYQRYQIQILTRIARLNYVNFKSEEKLQFQLKFSKILIELKESLIIEDEFSISNNLLNRILKLTQADGIAQIKNDLITKYGLTPDSDEIIRIKNWAIKNEKTDMFYSNTFYKEYKNEIGLEKTSGGVLFKSLDSDNNNFIIWFKKVKEPNFELEKKLINLADSERNSKIIKYSSYSDYETWLLNTEFKSTQWSDSDLYIIKEIINVILESIHVKSVKIRELYEQLKEINAELDSFSYTISHDLRTPLTVMKLNCQMLQRKLTEESTNKQVKDIIKEIDHISEMMEEILLLSKAKKSEINLVPVETNNLIHKLIGDCKIYYQSENTEVICGDLLSVLADKTMTYEIFLNVINNAIKYSSKSTHPKVTIKSEEVDNKIIYQISDNGIGIKPEDKQKMFKLFSRMSNTSGFRGNGVGLSIVLRMMERLDGEITFESEENVGTTFRLVFQKP